MRDVVADDEWVRYVGSILWNARTYSRLGALVVVLSATPASAADDPMAAARQHFKAGVALLEDPEGERFEDAYAEFQAAYELSKSPKILGNIGLCAMKLERDGEAINAYERYLKEVSDIDPEERAQVTRDLQTLTASAAQVTVTVARRDVTLVDTRVPVRGSSVRNAYNATTSPIVLLLRPGHHMLTARWGGKDHETWEFTATGGARLAHDFSLKEEPPAPRAEVIAPPPSRSNMPWVLVGIGGAALVGGVVTGILTLNKTSNVADVCPAERCTTASARDELHSAKTFATLTDVLFVGGAVVAGAGLTWFALSPSSKPRASFGDVRITGLCDGHGCTGGARGSF